MKNRSSFVLKKMGRRMCRIFLGICVFLGAIHACEYRTLAAPISDTGEILQGNSSCILTDEEAVTITISAVGDCTLGNDIKQEGYGTCFHKVYNIMGPDYFLENVRPIFQKDDLTIANLEGVLTNLGAPSQTKTWRFQSPPEYMQILTGSSVEAVSFANNHCRDYGEISFTDTKANLDLYGIDYASEDHPLVMEIKGVKVGLVALQCAIRSPRADLAEYPDTDALARLLKAEMDSVKEAGAQVIIVNMHWGVERQLTASPQQIALGHFAVDQGADLVIGHHPHILQAVECYNGKYILYSLGNFCFGGNINPPDKDTGIWQMQMKVQEGQVTDQIAQFIPCRLSAHTGWNDYSPVPLSGAEAQRVLDKMNRLSAPHQVYFNEAGIAFGR